MTMTSSGSRLYIGDAPNAAPNQGDYEAVVWTEVGEVSDLGEFGPVDNTVTFEALGERIVRKYKGTVNYGALALQLGRTPTDLGQAALIDAQKDVDDYAFKVVLQDGTTQYFLAKVMSYTTAVGGPNQITGATANVEITSEIIEVSSVTFTLTYTAGANGSILGTSPQTVPFGANGTPVAAVAASGYKFDAWSDGYPTAARVDLDLTANVTVTATFALI